MQSGINKGAVLIMKKDRKILFGGIKLSQNSIRRLQNNDGFKYLRVLQNDMIMEREMRKSLTSTKGNGKAARNKIK